MNTRNNVFFKPIFQLIFIFCALSSPSVSFGQATAKEGLERLQSNLDNAKFNVSEYQKNLEIVIGNLSEVTKAQTQVSAQRSQTQQSAKENLENLQKLQKKVSEVNGYILDEQRLNEADAKKVEELEKIILQLKANQEKRTANINQYQSQLQQVEKERVEWKSRVDQLSQIQKDVDARTAALEKQNKEWSDKKKGYEGEIRRWQREVSRLEKLVKNYNSIK